MKKIFLTLTLITFTLVAICQNSAIKQAQSQLESKGEIYFSFKVNDKNTVNELSKIISIDNCCDYSKCEKDVVHAYANAKEFAKLIEKGITEITLLPHPGDVGYVAMSSDIKSAKAWDTYPTYPAYVEMMEKFASDFPNICKLEQFGTSVNNRKLLSVRISDNVNQQEDEPVVFLTSTMHGDETTGYALMLRLIDYLLINYGQDDRVTNIVNNIVVVINPLANPDGTYASGNNTVNGATRYNANYVDLNRNYKDPSLGNNPDGEVYQPETLAFMEYADNNDFALAFNVHGGVEVLNYPWDTWSRATADKDWWEKILQDYINDVRANSPSGYMTYMGGITNGYNWYPVHGGRQDYMNYFQNCREFTLEISDEKLAPASQLPNFWNYNYKSFLTFIEQSLKGFRGIVKSEQGDNSPVHAKVFIPGFDKDNSHVYSTENVGDFHRFIKTGTYNVEFSAPGYVTKVVNNVSVNINDIHTMDVELWKGVPQVDFSSDQTVVLKDMSVAFTDLSKGYPTAWEWTFEGGTPATSTTQNPTVIYTENGTFNVKLKVTNQLGSAELVKENYILVTNGSGCVQISDTDLLNVYSSAGSIHITSKNDIQSLNIIDISGKVVYENKFDAGNNAINSVKFVPGVYIVKAIVNNSVVTRKIVVNR